MLETRCERLRKARLLITIGTQIERMKSKPLAVEALKPAFYDRAPYGVVLKMSGNHAHPDNAAAGPAAARVCKLLPLEPVGHDADAKVSVTGKQFAIVFFLVKKIERRLAAHGLEALRTAVDVDPRVELLEASGKCKSAVPRIGIDFVHGGKLRHCDRPAYLNVLRIERKSPLITDEGLIDPPAVPVEVPEAEMPIDKTGVQRHGLLKAIGRVFPTLLPSENNSHTT